MIRKLKEKNLDKSLILFTIIIAMLVIVSYKFIGKKLIQYQGEELIKYANTMGAVEKYNGNIDKVIKEVLSKKIEKENVQSGLKYLNEFGYFEGMNIENKWIGETFVKIRKIVLEALIFISIGLITIMVIVFYRYNKKLDNINKALEKVIKGQKMEILSEVEEGIIGRIYHNINIVISRLSIAKENLKADRDSTRTLLSELSHQLKTPLAGIKMNNELILEGYVDRDEEGIFLRDNNKNIDRMEWITNGLLKLSTLESKSINLNKKENNINETLIECINSVNGQAQRKNIVINILKLDEGILKYDKKWLGEAIINILDNGIKYSLENKKIDISLKIVDSMIEIKIKDEGYGISKEELDKIFKRFYRSYNDEIQKSEGSGIGLYLSKKIIEEHNGNIKVESKLREGSTFIITLYKHLVV